MTKPHLSNISCRRFTSLAAANLGAAFLAVAGLTVPASASPITFDLSNVIFQGGITATGSFAFDSLTDAVNDVNVTLSGPSSGFFDFFASGPVSFDTVNYVFDFSQFELGLLPPGGAADADLNLISVTHLSSSSPATTLLAAGSSGSVSSLEINGFPTNDIQTLSSSTAALVPQSAVPEPGTVWLMALALGVLAAAREACLLRRLPHRH
jgi:hypothetical protein